LASPRTILLAGPTAGGKSALAMRLAQHFGGVIINADSMQVYRDLCILTARPSPQDAARVPHALYGFVDGAQAYSAGRYAGDAERAIAAAAEQGRVPIVAGGTGLYFKALLEGLAPIPVTPEEIRRHWRAEARRLGAALLYEVLRKRDPDTAARLQPTDPQRIVRALEVLDATGQSLIYWQRLPGRPILACEETLRLVLAPPRAEIRRRCEARVDAMMAAGALDEVRTLAARRLDSGLPIMRALGVRPLCAHLDGRLGREEAVAEAKAETRQYAKRQQTWLQSHMREWQWPKPQHMERILDDVVSFLRQAAGRRQWAAGDGG